MSPEHLSEYPRSHSMKKDPAKLSEEDLDELYESTTDEAFPLISQADLPDIDDFRDNMGYLEIEDKLTAERYAELEGGADPTPEELTTYQAHWREGLSDLDYDMDKIPTCGVAPFTALDGRKLFALVCRTGYSFSQIDTWLEGVFPSEAEAVAYVGNYSKA
jgi:hypothetical protein